ncbi:MAG: amidohydrolase family protein [Pseudomonadota bacterium]
MKRLLTSIALLGLAATAVAETTAIVGATVHTVGPQGTIENATIIITDGEISAVGRGIAVPAGVTTVDASGKIVTPGLFSPIGRLGLVEVGNSAGPNDNAQTGRQFTAGFDVSNAYNRRSTLIAITRVEGVTSAITMPSPGYGDGPDNSGHVLAGQAAVVSLGDDDWLIKPRAGVVVTLGESGSNFAGGSRTAAFLQLKNALEEAIDYGANKRDFERGMRREYTHSMADLEALQPVLVGETPLIVNAHRASDLEAIASLASDYNVRVIITGGAEAWMVADTLAAADIAVVTTVTDNLPGNFDRINTRRGAAKILVDAGVDVALTDGASQTHNARNLTQSAGNAVADGMSRDAALRAITLTPAEMYGVADRVGSIEPGKAADLVIWPADPFEMTTYPDQVYIGGERISMESRQTLLRDRYLDPASDTPPNWRK